MAVVLKTTVGATPPGVRIPLPPPTFAHRKRVSYGWQAKRRLSADLSAVAQCAKVEAHSAKVDLPSPSSETRPRHPANLWERPSPLLARGTWRQRSTRGADIKLQLYDVIRRVRCRGLMRSMSDLMAVRSAILSRRPSTTMSDLD
jgi:hypothetical protein